MKLFFPPHGKAPRSSSPILVHCSAGVGRTGTLIAIASCNAQLALLRSYNLPDHLLNTIVSQLSPPVDEPGRISRLPTELNDDLVARTVDFLREQRILMVQTKEQLKFVYEAVEHFSASLDPCDERRPSGLFISLFDKGLVR